MFKSQNNHSSPKITTINPASTISDPHFFALFAVVMGRLTLVVGVRPVPVVIVVLPYVVVVEVVGLGSGVVVGSEDVVEVSEVGVEGVVGQNKE